MAKKFTAKQKAWRGALAIAIAVACLSIAPLLAIGDQPFGYQVTDEMAAENAGIVAAAETEEVVEEAVTEEAVVESLEVHNSEAETPSNSADTDSPENSLVIANEDENEALEAEQPEIVSADSPVAMIGDQEFASLQEAFDSASGNNIALMQDINESVIVPSNCSINLNGHTWMGNGASALTCNTTNPSIKIVGPGTIKAAEGYRVITVAGSSSDSTSKKLNTVRLNGDLGGSLYLKDVTLVGNGVGISNEGIARQMNGGSAYNPRGGAIVFTTNTKIEAENCSFSNGVTTELAGGVSSGAKGVGGAIAIVPGSAAGSANCSLVLSNCHFSNNQAYAGSAISFDWADGTSALALRISGCTFEKNSLSPALGLQFMCDTRVDLQIASNTVFSNNFAGALDYKGRYLDANIKDSSFSGNSKSSSASNDGAAAIRLFGFAAYGANATVSNCKFNSNTSNQSGGAVYATAVKTNLVNCSFSKNIGKQGGGVYLDAFKAGSSVEGCTFTDDSCTNNVKGGGALYLVNTSQNLAISNSVFSGNTAASGNGGAIYAEVDELTLNECVIDNNTANKGGGIYANCKKAILDSTTIAKNKATIKNTGTATTAFNNTSVSSGGVHFVPYVNNAEFIVKGATKFYQNTTPNEHPSLNMSAASSELLIADTSTKTTIVKADASTDGLQGWSSEDEEGNLYELVKYENAKISAPAVMHYQRYNNVLAVVYYDPSGKHTHSADLTFSSFENACEASQEKGNCKIVLCDTVVANDANAKYLNVSSEEPLGFVRCSENKANALVRVQGEASLRNVVFDGANVEASSPVVQVEKGAQLNIFSGVVIKNAKRTAGGNGAALQIGQIGATARSKVNIYGGIFENNKSVDGGAIYCATSDLYLGAQDSNADSQNVPLFKNNEATDNGGAIYILQEANLNINGATFESNHAGLRGGALMIADNSVKTDEGRINYVASAEIHRADFLNNYAEANDTHEPFCGGAIYNSVGCKLHMWNVIATENMNHDETYKAEPSSAFASCQTASNAAYKQDGALIYNNGKKRESGFGDPDLSITHGIDASGKTAATTVSDVALGGGSCNWHTYENEETGFVLASPSTYQCNNGGFALYSQPSEKTIQDAEACATVRFIGNEAYRSGTAVGNNGSMIIGTANKALLVKKNWTDSEGNQLKKDEIPDSIEVTLGYIENGIRYKVVEYNEAEEAPYGSISRVNATQVLSEKNNWTATWTDLNPQIEWCVIEDVPGYEGSLTVDSTEHRDAVETDRFALTNTWKDERTKIEVEKIWDDRDNQYQARPESIDVKLVVDTNKNGAIDEEELQADSTQTKTIDASTMNEDGHWHGEFTDLPKYTMSGETIAYLVQESSVANYASTSNTEMTNDGEKVTITNSLDLSKKELQVRKLWKDEKGTELAEGTPASIEVYLVDKDKNTVGDAVMLNDENNWSYTWTDLDAKQEWSVAEKSKIDGYDVDLGEPNTYFDKMSGKLITTIELANVWKDERTNIEIEKRWEDQDDRFQLRPESIELKLVIDANKNGDIDEEELQADSTQTKTIDASTMNEDGRWHGEFTNLPKYTMDGEAIAYLVQESSVEGYITEIAPMISSNDFKVWYEEGQEWSGFHIINRLEFGDLLIQKSLEGPVATMSNNKGNSTAIFRVEGYWGEDESSPKFYDNYVALNFDEPGSKTEKLSSLPIGAYYTVKEVVPDGSGYVVKEGTEAYQGKLFEKAEGAVLANISFKFENVSTNEDRPNLGIINTYNDGTYFAH